MKGNGLKMGVALIVLVIGAVYLADPCQPRDYCDPGSIADAVQCVRDFCRAQVEPNCTRLEELEGYFEAVCAADAEAKAMTRPVAELAMLQVSGCDDDLAVRYLALLDMPAENPDGPTTQPGNPSTQSGVHPDYPTLERAGTADLFFIEEPDRGPWITDADRPPTEGVEWHFHAYCEIDVAGLVCGPEQADEPSIGWRLARIDDVLVADELRFGRVDRTVLSTFDASDLLERLVVLDAVGRVSWSRTYDPASEQYSERALSGANRLRGCGYRHVERDEDGRAGGVTCMSWLNEAMRDTRGVVSRRFVRDEMEFVVEERSYDADGEPVGAHDGVHRTATERDGLGRVVATSFFGVSGEPVLSSEERASRVDLDYDSAGLVTARRIMGVQGQPSSDRVALERREYDDRGCWTVESFFDATGRPTNDFHGVGRVVDEMDEHCWVTRRSCFDASNRPVRCGPNEPQQYRYRYDDRGELVSARHFDGAGNPSGDPEFQVFEVRYRYDDLGRQVRTSCFGPSSQPVECSLTGFHAELAGFDEAGRSVTTTFEGVNGTPATNLGVSLRRATYDAYDHLYETLRLDAQGRVTDASGLARQRFLYDDGHRLFGVLLFDRLDQPARYGACFTGKWCPAQPWHAVAVVRGPDGRVTENRFFDDNARLIASIDCSTHACWD